MSFSTPNHIIHMRSKRVQKGYYTTKPTASKPVNWAYGPMGLLTKRGSTLEIKPTGNHNHDAFPPLVVRLLLFSLLHHFVIQKLWLTYFQTGIQPAFLLRREVIRSQTDEFIYLLLKFKRVRFLHCVPLSISYTFSTDKKLQNVWLETCLTQNPFKFS